MSTAEQLAFSIRTERRGVHVLLWDAQDDLVRALLVLLVGLGDLHTHTLLVSDAEKDLRALRGLVETRVEVSGDIRSIEKNADSRRNLLWLLFVQQASSNAVGPWLNGWRRSISAPPGALLLIRHADFGSFQRSAPDIASFIGARIYNASTMLSDFSPEVYGRLQSRLPDAIEAVLERLPGALPSEADIANWIRVAAPHVH